MILFLLLSIPLTYLLINSFYNNQNIKIRIIVLPFISGIILAIPLLLIYWVFFHSFFNNWSPSSLYLYYFFKKDGLTGVYAVLVVSLYFFFYSKPIKESRLREITAFLSGLYFVLSFYDTLVTESWYGNLELFMFPAARISSIFLLSILLSRTIGRFDWTKYLLIGLALLVPILTTFIPVLYVINVRSISFIYLIILLGSSLFMYILEMKGRLWRF